MSVLETGLSQAPGLAIIFRAPRQPTTETPVGDSPEGCGGNPLRLHVAHRTTVMRALVGKFGSIACHADAISINAKGLARAGQRFAYPQHGRSSSMGVQSSGKIDRRPMKGAGGKTEPVIEPGVVRTRAKEFLVSQNTAVGSAQ
jgi:hypothetical protein